MTATVSAEPETASAPDPATHLQTTTAAVRVAFTWLGIRKALTSGQKAQAAEAFDADRDCLAASKKLLDTRSPAYRALTAVRNRIRAAWQGTSLPYPEPGIRLIRQDAVEPFNARMTALREELEEAVEDLDRQWPRLRDQARSRLGSLYDPSDYPDTIRGLFAVEWDFPSVEPPSYLMRLDPRLYEEQRRRIVSRFEEAVRMAEEAFTAEFQGLVTHLVERLAGHDDGKPKVFRDSAIENLSEFFARFRALSVRSSPELDALVETARKALRGVGPQTLRDDTDIRGRMARQLGRVQVALDGLLVDRPRRRIIRNQKEET
jgi:hypothetical protein